MSQSKSPKAGERTRDKFNRCQVDFTQQCPARYATGELSQCKKCKGHPEKHEFDETAYPGLWAEYVKLNPREYQVIRATAYDAVRAAIKRSVSHNEIVRVECEDPAMVADAIKAEYDEVYYARENNGDIDIWGDYFRLRLTAAD